VFGLFGSTRKAATRAAIDFTRPLIGIIQHNYGLPPRFWFDPYVLGYTQFTIGHFAKLATQGKIAVDDLGNVLVDTYAALSNINGTEIARSATALSLAKDPDFNKGADDAAIVAFYKMGILKREQDNALVQKATAVVDQAGSARTEADRRSEIVSIMVILSFIHEIKARFDLP
jgi:hypothetical protein